MDVPQGDDPGVRVVLECIPLPNTLEMIQLELQRIVQPIPARPRETHVVTFDSLSTPERAQPTAPRSSRSAPGGQG